MKADSLPVSKSGRWAETKYSLVSYYSTLFSKAMLGKWECRVYLDLFAGPGLTQIKGSSRVVPTSPILALRISPQFDRYIYSEIDDQWCNALRTRVKREFPDVPVEIFQGDSNKTVEKIIPSIPPHSKSFRVLSFCFLDPFRIENLYFDTVRTLSKKFMDILILIPTHMDIHRNMESYCDPSNTKMDLFLGTREWRDRWVDQSYGIRHFGNFIVHEYGLQMKGLGYIYDSLDDTVLVRMPRRNIPLYRLTFFSRNEVGMKLWREAKQYTDAQLQLL